VQLVAAVVQLGVPVMGSKHVALSEHFVGREVRRNTLYPESGLDEVAVTADQETLIEPLPPESAGAAGVFGGRIVSNSSFGLAGLALVVGTAIAPVE
jgi:hypothetical protein